VEVPAQGPVEAMAWKLVGLKAEGLVWAWKPVWLEAGGLGWALWWVPGVLFHGMREAKRGCLPWRHLTPEQPLA